MSCQQRSEMQLTVVLVTTIAKANQAVPHPEHRRGAHLPYVGH